MSAAIGESDLERLARAIHLGLKATRYPIHVGPVGTGPTWGEMDAATQAAFLSAAAVAYVCLGLDGSPASAVRPRVEGNVVRDMETVT